MPVRHWHPRRVWAERLAEEATAEVARLQRTARYRLGRALQDTLRRPWRLHRLLRQVASILRHGPAHRLPPTASPPYPRADWRAETPVEIPTVEIPSEIPIDRPPAPLHTVSEILSSSAFRLGTLLVERRFADLLDTLERRPAPPPLRSRPRSVTGSIRTPDLPADLRSIGPDWWTELLAFEEVHQAPPGYPGDVLVGLCGPDTTPLLERVAPARRVIAWILDDRVPDVWLPRLRRCDHVLVADPALISPLSQRLERPVDHLPPAVQPKLDNPIGWWSNRPDLAVSPRAVQDRPRLWHHLARAARGQPLTPAEASALATALGSPLPVARAPAWAPAEEAPDWTRLVRYRAALQQHDAASRLCDVASRLGHSRPHPRTGERVSVVFASNRPELQLALLDQLARQSHPNLLAIGALHGPLPPGHHDALVRHAERSGLQTRFIPMAAHHTLGACVQAAFDASEGDYVMRIDDDNLYGAHYVADMALALRFSEAGLVFKHSLVLFHEASGRLALLNPQEELRYLGTNAGGGRMALRRELLERVGWRALSTGSDTLLSYDCLALGAPLLAADRFNHVFVRRALARHTWRVPFRQVVGASPYRALPPEARPSDFDV